MNLVTMTGILQEAVQSPKRESSLKGSHVYAGPQGKYYLAWKESKKRFRAEVINILTKVERQKKRTHWRKRKFDMPVKFLWGQKGGERRQNWEDRQRSTRRGV